MAAYSSLGKPRMLMADILEAMKFLDPHHPRDLAQYDLTFSYGPTIENCKDAVFIYLGPNCRSPREDGGPRSDTVFLQVALS